MLKLGPWGIAGGKPGDINRNPQRLVRISICITECINALEFMYDDQDGETTKVGTWGAYKYGGNGWTTHVLTLAFCLRDKYITPTYA
jgi:hypothetical protein